MSDSANESIRCGQCGKNYAWKPELAGRRVRCKCGGVISVPASTAAVVPVPVEAIPVAAAVPTVAPSAPPAVPKSRPGPPPPPPFSVQYAAAPAARSGRPGYSVGLGIASLLIGCISILASGFTAYTWNHWYTASIPPAVTPPPAVSLASYLKLSGSPPSVTQVRGEYVPPDGLRLSVREKIVAAAPLDGPAAPARRALLDSLLAERGNRIMLGRVTGTIRRDPQSRTGPENATATLGYLAPGGAIELGPDMGSFKSGSTTIVVAAGVVQEPGGPVRLSVAAINQAMTDLQKQLPKVTDGQAAFVRDQLKQSVGYNFPSPGRTDQPVPPISNASIGPDQVLRVQVAQNSYYVLPDGKWMNQARLQLDTGGNVLGIPQSKPAFKPLMPGEPQLMRLMAIYCLAVVGLAVFLIAAGLIIFVKPTLGLRLHVWFAVLKFGCIVTEVLLSLRFIDSVKTGNYDSMMQYDTSAGVNGVIMTVLMQLIYPIVILSLFAVNRWGRQRQL